jgi:hypothetical protein
MLVLRLVLLLLNLLVLCMLVLRLELLMLPAEVWPLLPLLNRLACNR